MTPIVNSWDPPDSATAQRAHDLCSAVSPHFLANHSSRTFAWGCTFAHHDGITFDREVFYVACMLHDVGLTPTFEGPRCFEHESAAVAARFAEEERWACERRNLLAEAIRLHMQVRVIIEDGREAYLLTEATSCDLRGKGLLDIDVSLRNSVLQAFPRLDFKQRFIELFRLQASQKPGCMADLYLQQGWAAQVLSSPFES